MSNRFNEENLDYGNIVLNPGPNAYSNNVRREEQGNMQNNNQKEENNFVSDFMNNPKEAIAKEMINKAGEQISRSWFDKCKCNFE
jgi:hypothetical protein